jgi:hypothetical protein
MINTLSLFKRMAALTLASFWVLTPALHGVQVTTNTTGGFFTIRVANTPWEFSGRAERLLSVSFQEYSTGPLIVSEVSIDMEGANQLLRIYSTRPVSATELERAGDAGAGASEETFGVTPSKPPTEALTPAKAASTRAENAYSRATAGIVVKTYPATTHAKTVEFSVKKREELLKFYKAFSERLLDKKIAFPGSLRGTVFVIE